MRLKKKNTKKMITTKLDKDLIEKLKSHAKEHGIFLCDIIEKSIEQYLERNIDEHIKKAKD